MFTWQHSHSENLSYIFLKCNEQVSANAQVLVPINSPQAQQYFQQQMRPQSITSSAEPMSYRELQKHQQWQQESQHKRPTSYGWQRARGKSKNYGEILEKRRHQLRQVGLLLILIIQNWFQQNSPAIQRSGFEYQFECIALVVYLRNTTWWLSNFMFGSPTFKSSHSRTS